MAAQGNPFENNPELQQYFSTLPKMIQESIMQSNLEFVCKADLQKCVDNLMKNQ